MPKAMIVIVGRRSKTFRLGRNQFRTKGPAAKSSIKIVLRGEIIVLPLAPAIANRTYHSTGTAKEIRENILKSFLGSFSIDTNEIIKSVVRSKPSILMKAVDPIKSAETDGHNAFLRSLPLVREIVNPSE